MFFLFVEILLFDKVKYKFQFKFSQIKKKFVKSYKNCKQLFKNTCYFNYTSRKNHHFKEVLEYYLKSKVSNKNTEEA